MSEESSSQDPVPPARLNVLGYQRVVLRAPVTVRRFFDPMEAQLYANELAAHDIEYAILSQNVATFLGWYSGFSQVELQVHQEDAATADQLLSRLQLDPADVEPAEDSDPQAPVPDPSGNGKLVVAGAYDNPRRLYDAAATLGSAHVEAFLPVLVPRGSRPAGTGRRFLLRVREPDLERAQEILLSDADEHEDEPRCPRCGSWQTYLLPRPWTGLWNLLTGRTAGQPRQVECLRCHHRWADS